jgi:hypothetical protein
VERPLSDAEVEPFFFTDEDVVASPSPTLKSALVKRSTPLPCKDLKSFQDPALRSAGFLLVLLQATTYVLQS